MARPASGQVVERRTQRSIVYALRFNAYGQRQYVTLGSRDEGWTPQRAQLELQNVLADVRRGTWAPTVAEPVPAPADQPSFHEFASEWLAEISPMLRPKTIEDYTWALSYHLLPFFAKHQLNQITVAEVDRYRSTKARAGKLGAVSINKTLTRLGQILDVAEEREFIARNPMSVNRRRRKLRVPAPKRTYIDKAEHLHALLEAAAQLDREARRDRSTHRRAILATLALAGLRISELLDLSWREVDLASGGLRLGHSKTAAGIREINLLPLLRDELAALKAARDPEPDTLVFATTRGARQTATNVRQRVLAKSVAAANVQLQQREASPLPDGLTLHSLRRTYASLLFAIGRTAPEVMTQLGHADPRLTLRVYAGVMSQDEGERKRLQSLVNGLGLGTKRHWAPPASTMHVQDELPRDAKPADFQDVSEWAVLGSNQRPPACKAGALTS
jgi:integrase